MKNVLKLASVLLVFCVCLMSASTLEAQKVAYVDSDAIIQAMPEYKRAKSEVEAYGKQLQKQLQAQEQKMMTYYQEIMQKAQQGQLSPQQQQDAEAKLQQMQQELQQAAVKADEDLVKKEQSLIEPLYNKFNDALSSVAKANSYGYILDKKLLLYSDGGIDATSAVKSKLGL